MLTQASFSYGGMEGLASICLEADNPRRTMKTAVRAIFYRIVGLYVLSLFMIGLCVSRSDPYLLQANAEGAGTAAQSPFVVVVKVAGVKVLDHIINAVVLTSAFSSGNEFLYSSSRALFMLAQQGQAPRIFSKILPNGVPIYSLAFTSLFSLLAYLNVSAGAEVAFNCKWQNNGRALVRRSFRECKLIILFFCLSPSTGLSNITTLGSQISWIGIAIAHTRFRRGMKRQGVPDSVLPFKSFLMPWGAWVVIVSFTIIVFFGGWTTLKPFSASDFFSTYVNLLIFFLLFAGFKIVKKTKWVSLDEMDVSTHYVEGSVVTSKYQK